jgi:hypothetical protein
MAPRSRSLRAVAAVLLAVAAGCIQKPDLNSGAVFLGTYPDGVNYNPFRNSSAADVSFDATVCYPPTSIYCPDGGSTLKVVVPGPGDPENAFAGGTLVSGVPRNLSGYDAVTFWAKSTRAAPLIVGMGADQSESPLYLAESAVDLTTEWKQYFLPIPSPPRLTSEKGLFYFSAGADGSPATGFTFWLAGIQYVAGSGAIAGPTAVIPATCQATSVGASFAAFRAGATPVAFAVNDGTMVVWASNRYFTYASSDPTVASVDPGGIVSVMGNGTATITGQLGGTGAAGPLTVKVGGGDTCPALPAPTTIAPTPTVPATNVISLFSSAYTNRPVDSWHTVWSNCCSEYSTPSIGGHPVKKYVLHAFNGVAISPDGSGANAIDASAMDWFHVDVWTPDGYAFAVKLVNDPTGYVSESTVVTYVTQTGVWVPIEIPMTAFRNLGGTQAIGQMLFLVPDGTSSTFYVDNVYFHN